MKRSLPVSPAARVVPTAASAAALAVLSVLLAACTPEPTAPARVPAVYVTEARAALDDRQRTLSGVLRPRVESELGLRVGGRLAERPVDVGHRVRRGDVLARLDATDHRLAMQAAADQLRAAEVDATQAASDAARFARLLADDSVGAADAERQQARADAAAARAAQARAQWEVARNRVDHATLNAPFDGVVTAVRAEAGQVVAEGQPVVTLARAGELEAVVDVPEAMAGELRRYDARALLSDAPTAAAQPLRLRELSPSANAATRTYRARYAVQRMPADWTLGRSVEVRLDQPAGAATVELPVTALLATDGAASVWLVDPADGTLRRQPVTPLAQGTRTVRVAGLPDGALVVSVGAQTLDAGLKVRPVRRPLEPRDAGGDS